MKMVISPGKSAMQQTIRERLPKLSPFLSPDQYRPIINWARPRRRLLHPRHLRVCVCVCAFRFCLLASFGRRKPSPIACGKGSEEEEEGGGGGGRVCWRMVAEQGKKGIVPEKYDVNAKWDACLDLTLRRSLYSSLAGVFFGLLLFRSPAARWASVAFGAGFGIGSAYTECSQKLDGFPTRLPPPKLSEKAPSPEPEPVPVPQTSAQDGQE